MRVNARKNYQSAPCGFIEREGPTNYVPPTSCHNITLLSGDQDKIDRTWGVALGIGELCSGLSPEKLRVLAGQAIKSMQDGSSEM